jgi:hypothetical protein
LTEIPGPKESKGNPPKVTIEELLYVALEMTASPASTTPLAPGSLQRRAVTTPVGSPDPEKFKTR